MQDRRWLIVALFCSIGGVAHGQVVRQIRPATVPLFIQRNGESLPSLIKEYFPDEDISARVGALDDAGRVTTAGVAEPPQTSLVVMPDPSAPAVLFTWFTCDELARASNGWSSPGRTLPCIA